MYEENLFSHNWLIKRLINKNVAASIPLMKGTLIDLGCGESPFKHEILPFVDCYIGLDWINSLHNGNVDVFVDLNCPLPFANESAHTVISFEVLEHICEPQKMLNESYRILKSGGHLILSVPFMWWVHEAPWDYFRYTRYGLIYLLEKAGYIDIQISETSGFWEQWVLKMNYQSKRLIGGSKLRRTVMKSLLLPFWFFSQHLSLFLTRYWPAKEETAGYFVIAKK